MQELTAFIKEHPVGVSLFAMGTGLVTSFVFAFLTSRKQEAVERAPDPVIAEAVVAVHDTYPVTGVNGLRILVGECYDGIQEASSINEVKRCFALDVASAMLDDGRSKQQRWPRERDLEYIHGQSRLKAALETTNAPPWFLEKTVYDRWVPAVEQEFWRYPPRGQE